MDPKMLAKLARARMKKGPAVVEAEGIEMNPLDVDDEMEEVPTSLDNTIGNEDQKEARKEAARRALAKSRMK